MIKKILAICLLALTACGDNGDTPEGVLSEDEMTDILLDVYITEGQVTNYSPRLSREQSIIVFDTLRQDILNKYDLTDSTFRISLAHYYKNPEKLDIIYSRVIDSLNLKVQQHDPNLDERP